MVKRFFHTNVPDTNLLFVNAPCILSAKVRIRKIVGKEEAKKSGLETVFMFMLSVIYKNDP